MTKVGTAAALIFASALAAAATVTLTGTDGNSCIYGAAQTDAFGNVVYQCGTVSPGGPLPTPQPQPVDYGLCAAYPGGYRLGAAMGGNTASQLEKTSAYYSWKANAAGYTPIIAIPFSVPTAAAPGAPAGKISIAESPMPGVPQAVYRWVSISEKPCDFGQGGTAKWTVRGASPTVMFNVGTSEDYILHAFLRSRIGYRIQAGKQYYLNIVNGEVAGWDISSCRAADCGIVIDIWKP